MEPGAGSTPTTAFPTHTARGSPGHSCDSPRQLEKAFGDAARKNLDLVLRMQRENGWFDACAFDRDSLPNTHAIAYTLRGLAESFALTGDERYLQAVVLTAEALMRKLEVIGTLPATFTPSWTPAARYVCLTGLVQLGGVFLARFRSRAMPATSTPA